MKRLLFVLALAASMVSCRLWHEKFDTPEECAEWYLDQIYAAAEKGDFEKGIDLTDDFIAYSETLDTDDIIAVVKVIDRYEMEHGTVTDAYYGITPKNKIVDNQQTSVEVGFDADSPNVKWNVSIKKQEKGTYSISYEATFKEGYHGYAMADFSAPYFEIEGAEIIGDIFEPIAPIEEYDEEYGNSYIYYERAVYVQEVRAKAGNRLNGFIQATICNESNLCTSNVVEFTLNVPK